MQKISLSTLVYLLLLSLAFVSILPFHWMFISAIKTTPEIFGRPLRWWPSIPQWENFVRAWDFLDPPLLRALLNSAIVYSSHTLLLLLASSLTGYVLAKYRFKGRHGIFLWIVSQMMIPGFTGLIPSYMIMKWLGWINTYAALIIPGAFSAYSIFLMRQYIITIPDDILDAARLSGCSELGLFWRIILPLCKPALAAVGLINFVWGWNDLLWPMWMIHDTPMKTVQQTLAGLWDIRSSRTALPLVAASVTIATVPLIVLTVITQRHLLKGWTGLSYAKR
nr:carbohydrate ABC transporter permease [Candidatus Njordarchaeum guaymaensis]